MRGGTLSSLARGKSRTSSGSRPPAGFEPHVERAWSFERNGVGERVLQRTGGNEALGSFARRGSELNSASRHQGCRKMQTSAGNLVTGRKHLPESRFGFPRVHPLPVGTFLNDE